MEDIRRVHQEIRPYIHHTPVLHSSGIDQLTGAEIYFKCENFQKIGAFKIRGAMSAALALDKKKLKKGLTTHSSGNHAQGVALAAKLLGTDAHIVMPENSVASKMKATRKLGAKIITCEPTSQAREQTVIQLMTKKGLTYIHPYNDFNVLAGQGTIALEFLEQQDNMDCILAPVSGGGLLSGVSIVVKGWNKTQGKNISVFGTEPKRVDDCFRAFYSGKLKINKRTDTICDGLRANIGFLTFPIILRNTNGIFTAKEKTIIQAMRMIWEKLKIIVEPSSAVPLASVLENKKIFKGKKIGIIISGGNVDLNHLPF